MPRNNGKGNMQIFVKKTTKHFYKVLKILKKKNTLKKTQYKYRLNTMLTFSSLASCSLFFISFPLLLQSSVARVKSSCQWNMSSSDLQYFKVWFIKASHIIFLVLPLSHLKTRYRDFCLQRWGPNIATCWRWQSVCQPGSLKDYANKATHYPRLYETYIVLSHYDSLVHLLLQDVFLTLVNI